MRVEDTLAGTSNGTLTSTVNQVKATPSVNGDKSRTLGRYSPSSEAKYMNGRIEFSLFFRAQETFRIEYLRIFVVSRILAYRPEEI
jgi:hypothetical protein